MHSRLLHLLFGLWIVSATVSLRAQGDYQFTIADGAATITGYTGPGGDLVIPATLGGAPVRKIDRNVFSGTGRNILSVTFPDGLQEIGIYAFNSSDTLRAVHFSSSIRIIREGAFSYCTALTSVAIPDGVEEIEITAFAGCATLASVSIPATLARLSERVFDNCPALASISVDPLSPHFSSDNGILYDRLKTALLRHPQGLNLTAFTVPDTVTRLGGGAFQGCASLTSINLPATLLEIGGWAFERCSNLAAIDFPPSLQIIGEVAFSRCNSLQTVTVPPSVITLGGGAFNLCDNLRSATILSPLSDLPAGLFYACRSLHTLTLPNSIRTIGPRAFRDCANLSTVNGLTAITTIGEEAFYGTGALGNVPLGSIVSIQDRAFYQSGLTNVFLPSTAASFGASTFFGSLRLTNVVFAHGFVTIPAGVFGYCNNLRTVSLPETVAEIGDSAFAACPLASIPLPSRLQVIGRNAFEFNSTFIDLVLPESVTTVGHSAFIYCPNLRRVTLPASIQRVHSGAFANCQNLVTVFALGNKPAFGTVPFNDTPAVFQGSGAITIYYLPGATGWTATAAGRPTRLWNVSADADSPTFGLTDGRFGFPVTGSPGLPFTVQVSDSLTPPAWRQIGETMTLSETGAFFTDPEPASPSAAIRIFRLRP